MSRRLLRSVAELPSRLGRPLVLLPGRPTTTRAFNTTSQIVEPPPSAPLEDSPVRPNPPPSHSTPTARAWPRATQTDTGAVPSSTPAGPSSEAQALTSERTAADLPESVRMLLPHLAAQPAQYIRIHIHGFPYLVTAGDQVRLPFKMPGVLPGDVLRLDRASVLGSRDFTLQGGSIRRTPAAAAADGGPAADNSKRKHQAAYIDERLFECRAVVLGTESEPMRLKVKKKRRCRRTKTIASKHRYTILRISEIKVNQLEDLEA